MRGVTAADRSIGMPISAIEPSPTPSLIASYTTAIAWCSKGSPCAGTRPSTASGPQPRNQKVIDPRLLLTDIPSTASPARHPPEYWPSLPERWPAFGGIRTLGLTFSASGSLMRLNSDAPRPPYFAPVELRRATDALLCVSGRHTGAASLRDLDNLRLGDPRLSHPLSRSTGVYYRLCAGRAGLTGEL
jgi:hypothetical protein